MNKVLGGLAAVACLTAVLLAQSDVRVITRPSLPPREVLDRLRLDVAWRAKVKLETGRDGIYSVQLFPSATGAELLVQTNAGATLLFDGETGDLLWRTPLEGAVQTLGAYNPQSIFISRGPQVYVLNRKNGMHRLYSTQPGYPDPVMGYRLPAVPSAPLKADGGGLFVVMGQRIAAYAHPDFETAVEVARKERDKKAEETNMDPDKVPIKTEAIKETALKIRADAESQKTEPTKGNSLQPVELWSYLLAGAAVYQEPLTTFKEVCVVTSAGNFVSLNRFESKLRFDFKLPGQVSVPMGQYQTTAYLGSDDYTLYALDMEADRVVWRFLSGAPILRKPEVTDNDIFVTADRVGMYRLQREYGREIWLNARADQFLATNGKFVYALDRKRQLLVLDALRGTTLAAWDAHDWTMALSNEWTDRIYLAAQDGQVMCLHHRDVVAPMKNRALVTLRPPEEKKPKEPKKDDVEVKDDKKDEKKVDKKEEKKEDKKEEKKEEKKVEKKEDKKEDKKEEKKDDKKIDDKNAAIGVRQLSGARLAYAHAIRAQNGSPLTRTGFLTISGRAPPWTVGDGRRRDAGVCPLT